MTTDRQRAGSSQRKQADAFIHARWIIPVDGSQTCLDHHTLVLNNNTIADILPTATADRHWSARQQHHLAEHALIPGFINTHGHAAMTLFRGLADDLPVLEWLKHHIWPAEAQFVSDSFVYDGTSLAIAEMIRGGTTLFSDNYFYPEAAGQAAVDARISCQLVFPVLDMATNWSGSAEEAMKKGDDLFSRFQQHDTVSVGFGPHAPYTVQDGQLKEIIAEAERRDVAIQMHIHESLQEVEEAVQKSGMRPLARLARLGLLSERLQCTHMVVLNETEIELLAKHDCSVLHCPQSNLKLASGFAPIARLRKAGVNIALGTDGACSNNDLDMLDEARTASLLAKASCQDATAMGAWETLRAATLGGAQALGVADRTGSLEVGKRADIAAVRLDELENLPLYDPVSQLIYTCGRHQVTDVWCNGHMMMNNRHLTTLDEADIRRRACEWQRRIASTMFPENKHVHPS